MKSSTSQRAGSSRTFLKTMYLTSGAYVITRRLRACRSPVRLYSRHSARDSCGEMRFRFVVADFIVGRAPSRGARLLMDKGCIGPGPQSLHHPFVVIAFRSSP